MVCVCMCVHGSYCCLPPQNKVLRDAGISLALVGVVVVYFLLVVENSHRNQAILGVLCNIFSVLFFVAPLASMVRV